MSNEGPALDNRTLDNRVLDNRALDNRAYYSATKAVDPAITPTSDGFSNDVTVRLKPRTSAVTFVMSKTTANLDLGRDISSPTTLHKHKQTHH